MVLMACSGCFRFDVGMKQTLLFITGTDTGVGKTVLTALLTRFLREQGINAAALKPVCSGSRSDARALHAAMDGKLTLDEINPWHFRAPVAPLLAARREKTRVRLPAVLTHARAIQKRFDVVLVEGAGGLFSPLGEGFHSGDLIASLRATPVIVGSNSLGVVNLLRLTLHALPPPARAAARIVLMSPATPDAATRSNALLLGEFCRQTSVFTLPWLGEDFAGDKVLKKTRVQRVLSALFS